MKNIPEWILKAPQRDPVLGRGGTQVVLDLANPEVQDFVFKVVDDLMTNYPEIAYIKWDANMAIMNHGSNYLPADKQSHMYIEFHKGFEKICQRIRAKYPDLTIQACASGGGRANYGILPYFDEFLGERQYRCTSARIYAMGEHRTSSLLLPWLHISAQLLIIRLSVPFH